MTDCILCANGNDLPEGGKCPGCGREGHALHSDLRAIAHGLLPADGELPCTAKGRDEVRQAIDALLRAADEIERLRATLDKAVGDRAHPPHRLNEK